ncbi:MAG: trypsin-like serine protease [Rhodobacteraceae bacterium]|nr:trypsin-like serine protease [Paracoccaceae bacterium]
MWAAASHAQESGFRTLASLDQGKHWEAVGRLEIAGTAFCTGALIASDLVLTAAHCLYDAKTGRRVPVQDIQFLAGWRKGRAAAYRYVRTALHHPDYAFSARANPDRVRNDVALLKLQHPIRNTTITPFQTDVHPARGDRLGVVSYGHDRTNAPSLQEVCDVIARQEGVLVMSCEVDFGSSGSPVFSYDSGVPRIVSVVSAKAEYGGQPVSLGTSLQEPLRLLTGAMVAAQQSELTAGQGKLGVGARSVEMNGAKFVRP